ncbi:nucleoside deaminase [Parashewanella tropica]|uniref:nucleoside deaminase n=1 Tax=Parashewanella tropica TaxID=2547970 RepID=UPI001C5547E2|nr:nucleoside deaminase [Parashewanella tropica]
MCQQTPFIPTQVSFQLDLPSWLTHKLSTLPQHFDSDEKKMQLVLECATDNFQRNTGGPFAAGVFERDTGKLVAMGVNRVVPTQCSSAHAEVMALSMAQQVLSHYDLGRGGFPAHQIVINWRPCAMCFGAILWSGVRSVMIAGAGAELEAITGFDEGPMTPNWRQELESRGIELVEGVMNQQAIELFENFAATNRPVYNARVS